MNSITAALLLVALATPAYAQVSIKGRDCVYDYSLLTERECRSFRVKVLKAHTRAERVALQQDLERTMDERARERGIERNDWRGLSVAPVKTSMAH